MKRLLHETSILCFVSRRRKRRKPRRQNKNFPTVDKTELKIVRLPRWTHNRLGFIGTCAGSAYHVGRTAAGTMNIIQYTTHSVMWRFRLRYTRYESGRSNAPAPTFTRFDASVNETVHVSFFTCVSKPRLVFRRKIARETVFRRNASYNTTVERNMCLFRSHPFSVGGGVIRSDPEKLSSKIFDGFFNIYTCFRAGYDFFVFRDRLRVTDFASCHTYVHTH